MKTPDFTPAQLFAAVAVAAAIALSHLGWMTTDQFFGVCAVAGLHIGGDAVVRNGRAKVVAAGHQLAAAQVANLPKDGNDSIIPPQPAQNATGIVTSAPPTAG